MRDFGEEVNFAELKDGVWVSFGVKFALNSQQPVYSFFLS